MNKISKGKAVGLLSLGLASVALGSVGFAAWVVSGTTVSAPNSVSASVGTISDERITMTAEVKDSTVAFESKTSDVGPITSTENKEDLIFSIGYTLTAGADLTNGAKATWAVALPSALNGKNYVTYVGSYSTETCTDGSEITSVTAAKGATKTGTIYFKLGWGSAFKGKNPSELVNSDFDTITLDSVINGLKDLKAIMAEEANKITVTFSASVNA